MAQMGLLSGFGPFKLNRPACCFVARTVTVPSSASSQPIATAVWAAFCGSIPMMTFMSTSWFVGWVWRILRRLDMNRLPASQHHKPHARCWKR